MIQVSIANHQAHVKLNLRWLVRLVHKVLTAEGVTDAQIGLAFVDDARIAVLNERFLGHQGPTDVLTFPLNDADNRAAGFTPAILAELVISAETAKRTAHEMEHPVEDEIALYVIHGCLHLCGYDDRTAKERRRMRKGESVHLEQSKHDVRRGASPRRPGREKPG
jgi:probable rRNA maturation factor